MEVRKVIAHPAFKYGILYACWLGLFARIFLGAWVSEDAYITLRVVDNFIAGYGLRWNIAERVQVFTHPLWLLLHLPFAAIWHNHFHLTMALGIACSSAAIALVLLTFRERPLWQLLGCFLLPLALSKCFLDYTTSGLETSLSFLLLAAFGYVLVRCTEHRFYWLFLSLISALLLVNRLDHTVILAPFWLWVIMMQRGRWPQMIAGGVPLVAWLLFSLFYYGFLFPNTKYAKLNTGFDLSVYLTQGMNYAFIWLTHDTVSVLTLLLGIFVALRRRVLDGYTMLTLGVILHCGYVLYIGGDYMMGRFWAFAFFACSWLLLATSPMTVRRDIAFATAAAFFTCFIIPTFVLDIRKLCASCIPVVGKVIDANVIFHRNRLFSQTWPPEIRREGQYKFAKGGKEMAAETTPPFKSLRYVGMTPYYAGARATFIDEFALADPLLARLPALKQRMFYVGHFRRDIPEGYIDALKTNQLDSMDKNLARYYEKLRLLTRGDLWESERLMTILRFNSGQYDHYKQRYLVYKK